MTFTNIFFFSSSSLPLLRAPSFKVITYFDINKYILFFGNILEVMMEEVYKQNFMDTYVFIKSKKELEKKVEMDGCGLINRA